MHSTRRFAVALFCIATLLCACAKNSTPSVPATPPPPVLGDTGGKIKHIVFIVQENRTFDNLFGGPNPYPGADAASSGTMSSGTTVALDKIELECTDSVDCASDDPNNFHQNFLNACDPTSGPPFAVGSQPPCRMDGFDVNQSPGLVYSYVDYAETKPYWDMAHAYALGDRFFMSHNSESYVAHQYIFSGQSNNVVDEPDYHKWYPSPILFMVPWGCDAPSGTTTLTLDAQGNESPSATGPFPCLAIA